jgi:predicted Zn-dependent protease
MRGMPRSVLRVPALALAAAAACATSRAPRPAPASAPAPAAAASAPAAAAPEAPTSPPPEVLVARARALRVQGDAAGAQELLETAFRATPAQDDVRLELADLLVCDGREPARAAALLEGMRLRGGARWNVVAGRLAEVRGDDGAAVDLYARALAAADDPDVRFRRALALERLARADEATAELERVRASRPDDALASAHLAERYEASGRTGDAEAQLRAAAEAQPDRAAGWERLARFYARTGHPAAASEALARAREAGGRGGRSLRPLLPSVR